MALDDILIKIRTTFEGKGAQEASKSLDALDQSSRRAAPALDKTGEAAGKAGKATRVSAEEFTRAARSASVLTGSMEGLGALVSQVATRFAGIAKALPVIGAVIALVNVWYETIMAVVAAQKAAAASLRDITAGNADGRIHALAESFEKLQKSISKAADEEKRYVEGQQAMADSERDLTLAKLDADEQSALSKEPDPLKQAVIKAQFSERRVGVSSSAAVEAEMRKRDSLGRQRSLSELAAGGADEQVAALLSEYQSVSARGGSLAAKQKKAMDGAWFTSRFAIPFSDTAAGNELQPERDRNLKQQQTLQEEIKAAKELGDKSRGDAAYTSILLAAQSNRIQQSTISSRTTATAAAAGTTTATTAVSVADLAAQRAAAEAQLPQYQQQASTAQEYLSTIPDRIASGTYSQADQAAMQRALAAAEEQTALLQSFISRIGQEMSKQNEILRTLPSSR